METPRPPTQPTHDPPPAPLHPAPGIPEPQRPPGRPEPGLPEPGQPEPAPAHDPPLYPEHDRTVEKERTAREPDVAAGSVIAAGAASSAAVRSEESSAVGSEDQVQRTLDEALADSFPASDPVSIVTSQHEEAWQNHHDAGGPGKSSSRH